MTMAAKGDQGAWRPIQTAPLNGQFVLLCWAQAPSLRPAVAYAFVEDNKVPVWRDEDGGVYPFRPTHWQPLPAVPVLETEAPALVSREEYERVRRERDEARTALRDIAEDLDDAARSLFGTAGRDPRAVAVEILSHVDALRRVSRGEDA